MSKWDRLLYLLQLIRVRRNLDVKRLAEECGVSERTIYRDVNSLEKDARIDIFYDRGFKLADETFLPPLNFNLDELLILWVGLQSAPVKSNTSFAKTAKGILVKIETQLPENTKRDFRNLREMVKVATKAGESLKEALYFRMIMQALTQFRNVDLGYGKGGKSQSYGNIQPKELIWKRNGWKLDAIWNGTKKAFELSKITNISLIGL